MYVCLLEFSITGKHLLNYIQLHTTISKILDIGWKGIKDKPKKGRTKKSKFLLINDIKLLQRYFNL